MINSCFRRRAVCLPLRLCLATLLSCSIWLNCACSQNPPGLSGPPACPGSELFVDGKLSQVQIEIPPQELDHLRKETRDFVRATVKEAGRVYPEVGVHLKGSVGSFRPVEDKPGLTLDFARFNSAQRFHGLRRIHLNNSVEDPTYCNEQLGSELFRAAGIPAPRVSRATVTLNGRRLGLYVLKEGFTEDFLSCYFKNISGNLFEPDTGHDVNQHLKRTSIRAPARDRKALLHLAGAVLETKPLLSWQQLEHDLDVDRFVRFMALEVMLCHRDGYCLARNNFRLYQDADSGKFVFLPHGMDQLFGSAELPWQPHMAGLVAQAVLRTPRGQERYRDTFRTLFETLLRPEVLSNRVEQIIGALRLRVDEPEFKRMQSDAFSLNQKIYQRWQYLNGELARPSPQLLEFKDGKRHLEGWVKADEPKDGEMELSLGPSQVPCLRIATRSDTTASWRTKAWLGPGRYRFEGRCRVQDVRPLSFGTHQGAGLRIGSQTRQSPNLTGSTDWITLATEFDVAGSPREVEFICEFRASSGQAWFDSSSLTVVEERQ